MMGKTTRIVAKAVLFWMIMQPAALAQNASLSAKRFPRLAPHIGQMNPDGSFGSLFSGIGSGFDGPVATLIPQTDGKMIVWGDFSHLDGKSIESVVRLQPDGSLDPSFRLDPAFKLNSQYTSIACIALQPDGKLLIGGGDFLLSGEKEIRHLVRLLPDGTLDQEFLKNTMPLKPSEKLVLEGSPSDIDQKYEVLGGIDDGTVKKYVVNLSPFRAFRKICSIRFQVDGKILLAGYLGEHRRLIRLNPDGSPDETFKLVPETEVFEALSNDNPLEILLQPDGKIVVGGVVSIQQSPGSEGRVIRLNPDGTLDNSFEAATLTGFSRLVNAFALQADGKF